MNVQGSNIDRNVAIGEGTALPLGPVGGAGGALGGAGKSHPDPRVLRRPARRQGLLAAVWRATAGGQAASSLHEVVKRYV